MDTESFGQLCNLERLPAVVQSIALCASVPILARQLFGRTKGSQTILQFDIPVTRTKYIYNGAY